MEHSILTEIAEKFGQKWVNSLSWFFTDANSVYLLFLDQTGETGVNTPGSPQGQGPQTFQVQGPQPRLLRHWVDEDKQNDYIPSRSQHSWKVVVTWHSLQPSGVQIWRELNDWLKFEYVDTGQCDVAGERPLGGFPLKHNYANEWRQVSPLKARVHWRFSKDTKSSAGII